MHQFLSLGPSTESRVPNLYFTRARSDVSYIHIVMLPSRGTNFTGTGAVARLICGLTLVTFLLNATRRLREPLTGQLKNTDNNLALMFLTIRQYGFGARIRRAIVSTSK